MAKTKTPDLIGTLKKRQDPLRAAVEEARQDPEKLLELLSALDELPLENIARYLREDYEEGDPDHEVEVVANVSSLKRLMEAAAVMGVRW